MANKTARGKKSENDSSDTSFSGRRNSSEDLKIFPILNNQISYNSP